MIVLETERLILRHYIESDLDDAHRLFSDKKTMYFLDDIITYTVSETAESIKTAMQNRDGQYFCIRGKSDDIYIGGIGYTVTSNTPLGKTVHLGYFLLPEHHRRGYAPEAAKRVLKFAFEEDDCVRVTTGCYKDNEPSRKVMEKVGFRKEAERLRAQYHDGVMKDRLEYAMNRDEFVFLVR